MRSIAGRLHRADPSAEQIQATAAHHPAQLAVRVGQAAGIVLATLVMTFTSGGAPAQASAAPPPPYACGFTTKSDSSTYLFYWNCHETPRIVRAQHVDDHTWLAHRWLVACVGADRSFGFGNIAQYEPYTWVETNQTCSNPPWFSYP